MSKDYEQLPPNKPLQCGAFDLPESPLLSEETRKELHLHAVAEQKAIEASSENQQLGIPSEAETLEQFYQSTDYLNLRNRYPVDITTKRLTMLLSRCLRPLRALLTKTQIVC